MRAANVFGIISIVILMAVLLFIVIWYDQTLTGAAIVDQTQEQVQQLESSLQEKNKRITTLQKENTKLRTELANLKEEVEQAIEEVQLPPSRPVVTTESSESSSPTLPPGPSDIDLEKARDDLSLSRQQRLKQEAIYADRDDRAERLIDEKIASIKSSNTLMNDRFSQHRITLICRIDEKMLFTVTEGKSYDTGLVWYYDPIDLGNLRSRQASLSEAREYETSLTCET